MKLLTEELRFMLPKLYGQEKILLTEQMVYAKFFHPAADWTWFVTEGDAHGDDFMFFGYVVGLAEEYGYFGLNELEGINVNGLIVERDLYFQPGKFGDVIARFQRERRR